MDTEESIKRQLNEMILSMPIETALETVFKMHRDYLMYGEFFVKLKFPEKTLTNKIG